MTILEIVLLVLGALVFVASFVVPETLNGMDEETEKISEDIIKKLVEEQVRDVEDRIDESVDETVSYAVEKSERAMERLTNEKITAISEFADTVLSDINKNNQEVMFMYDMLHDKQKNLKETATMVDKTSAEARAAKTELETATIQMRESAKQVEEVVSAKAPAPQVEKPKTTTKKVPAASSIDLPSDTSLEEDLLSFDEDTFSPLIPPAVTPDKVKKSAPKKKTKVVYPSENKNIAVGAVPELSGVSGDGSNNNERILEMHREGKSNVAIAKALGLGVGEVNLVIDLFEVM